MRTYGLSPRHVSHTRGNSVSSHFCLLSSRLMELMAMSSGGVCGRGNAEAK